MTNRTRLSLDGRWQFRHQVDPKNSWRAVTVPGPWQAQFDDLRLTAGEAHYRLEFHADPSWAEGSAILHFGAVDYQAQVWLNGQLLGEHSGGYLPFEFEVADLLAADGRNLLQLRVLDPTSAPMEGVEGTFADIPHGKQSWYGPLSGIWQSVWLEARPTRHIGRLKITPDAGSGQVQVEASLSQPLEGGDALTLELLSPAGESCWQSDAGGSSLTGGVTDPQLWDLDAPNLYTARVTLTSAAGVDVVEESFGFRTIETAGGRLLLNGRPIYLRGALDQDYYPDLIYTPPSTAAIEDQFRQAKEMGLNCMRIHIKIGDPRYYQTADRLGLLVWTELPNWAQLNEGAKRRGLETIAGMIQRDYNHPSIIIWTIINEAWGTDIALNPDHRAWLAELAPWVRQLDPSRLVVDNSPCFPNFHVDSDLDDFHYYAAMPDGARRWDSWVAGFAARSPWLYGPEHQHNLNKRAPLIVSEFGNWGLPDIAPLKAHYQGEPWWFETGWDWSGGDVYPHDADQRFYQLHLDKVFGDYAGLARASQWAQFEALRYEIEQMRLHDEITGYVITEWTDLHWECNGLLDMLRRPKAFHARLPEINADTMIIPRGSFTARGGGEYPLDLTLSHYGAQPIAGAVLTAALDGGDGAPGLLAQETVDLPPAQLLRLPRLGLPLPPVDRPTRLVLDFKLTAADGRLLARCRHPLTIFPEQAPVRGAVSCADPDLVATLAALGYQLASGDGLSAPRVVTRFEDEDRRFVEKGGRLLFLAEQPDALNSTLPRLSLHQRQGHPWSGDWASSFSWYRKDLWAGELPGDGRLDFSFESVLPETVISSARTGDFEREVLAGLFLGWLRRPAALVQEMPVGEGRLLVSTLRLRDALKDEPMAQTIFQALLDYLGEPA